jgi:hypothetical protein
LAKLKTRGPAKIAIFFGSATPCASPPGPSIFSDYSLLACHPVNRDDWHLLAHAMASDFTVAWQTIIGFYSFRVQPNKCIVLIIGDIFL